MHTAKKPAHVNSHGLLASSVFAAFSFRPLKELFLDAPQARPTLMTAAEFGVPVFVHPITDTQLNKRFAPYGRIGTTLKRGTINSAALVALLESDAFDEVQNLRIVVTMLAIGMILLAGGFGDGARLRSDAANRHGDTFIN